MTVSTSPQSNTNGSLVLATFSALLCAVSLGGYLALKPQFDAISELITHPRVALISSGVFLATLSGIYIIVKAVASKEESNHTSSKIVPILKIALVVHLLAAVCFVFTAGFLILK